MAKSKIKKTRFKEPKAKLVTKPAKPNRFRFATTRDPALILLLREKGIMLATLRGTYADDGSQAYEPRVYWPVQAVAEATGRKARMIRNWVMEGKFFPARIISGRPVWAEDDVDRLLREGDFFKQELHPLDAEELEKQREAEGRARPVIGGGKTATPDPLRAIRF
jgi:hypothetical protein